MADAVPAGAAPAAAPAPLAAPGEPCAELVCQGVHKAAAWQYTHDFKHVSLDAILGAAFDDSWCSAPFTAFGAEWRVVLKPNKEECLVACLELSQYNCTVELQRLSVMLSGLGVQPERVAQNLTFCTRVAGNWGVVAVADMVSLSHAELRRYGPDSAAYGPNGRLRVVVTMRAKPPPPGGAPRRPPQADPQRSLLRQLSDLRAAGTSADVTIRFSGAHAEQPAV